MVQFKPRQANPGLELRTWGHPAVADCTVKVEEAKGGDRAGTQDKWGLMEVDRCMLTEECGVESDVGKKRTVRGAKDKV